jgi:bifunctional DNA-binding transcriptional regulator/antitoxin component of YhaV-PrlF toxin-antitoxin module
MTDGSRSYVAGKPEEQDLYLVEAVEVAPGTGSFVLDGHGTGPHKPERWYIPRMTHTRDTLTVRLVDRGRLVLPAQLRRRAGLREGQELVLTYTNGVVRLATRAELARAGRGMFSDAGRGRDLISELIAERREEALREDAGVAGPTRRRRTR